MRIAGILAATALLVVVSHRAHADGKAWAAARAGLPVEAKLIVGVDVAAFQKSQLFATLYPRLIEKADAAKLIDTVKDACKIDPLAAMQAVVVATSSDREDGAVYIALSGLDRARLSACLQVAAQKHLDSQDKPDPTARTARPAKTAGVASVVVRQDGNITEVSDGHDTVFLGWSGKDVLVVSLHAQDRPSLVKWMGGKGALGRSELARSIARTNTSATMWGASEVSQEVQDGVTVKGGYGAVKLAKGNLDADFHAVMGSPAQATTMAATAQKQLEEARQGGQMPPGLIAMLKTVTIAATSNEVVIKANVGEKDVLGLMAIALGGLGGP
ncbi:MAG TPA: hypothetical protein VFT22_22930 [Kofleriaceae bacterium]|nr:hypothetical protein [Kofleriaceae bacterium]